MSEKILNGNKYQLSGCYIEITSRCNLRCKHCYNESGVLKEEISLEALNNVLRCYDENVYPFITLSGGEPLLHPQFWDILKTIQESGVRNILLITNATLITRDIAKRLADSKIAIQVSLNGSSAATHDLLCGKGSFEATLKGLQNLVNAEAERVLVRFTMAQCNKKDFVNTVELCAKMNIENVLFGALAMRGRAKSNSNNLEIPLLEIEEIVEDLKKNEKLKMLKKNKFPNFGIPEIFTGGCPLVIPSEEIVEFNPRIDSSGNVFLCQSFSDQMYAVGNINKMKVSEIMKTEDFSRILNFLYTSTFYKPECETCLWNSICGRGCIAQCINQCSNVQGTDGECLLRRRGFAREMIREYL